LRRISKALVVVLTLSAAIFAGQALAAGSQAAGAKAAKAKVAKVANGQRQILKSKAIKVTVKSKRAGKVKLAARSKTFDDPKFKRLTKNAKLRFRRPGTKTAKLKLTGSARKQVAVCGARTIKVGASKGKAKKTHLIRNTKDCKPKPVDLSRAGDCDFIAAQEEGTPCLLPFPDNYYTVEDASTRTGLRVDLHDAAMPANEAGVPIDADPYNASDGFSPGQVITLRVAGLDTPESFAKTDPIPLNQLSRNESQTSKEPIVVIDAETGERVPIWVELDSNATTPASTALLIHGATQFKANHRYIVAMRKLKDSAGKKLAAPEGFRYYRDELPTKEKAIKSQRKRFEKIFKKLRKAKVKRADLYLAWDFTVASDENNAQRLLHIRDDAFAQLGDTDLDDGVVQGTAPAFVVNTVDPAPNPEIARRVRGTFTVPCYLTNGCAPPAQFSLNASGNPTQQGTYEAKFDCIIPHAAVDDPGAVPGRASLYGHGLLGSAGEVASAPQRTLAQAHNFVFCATDTVGFSSADIPNTISILQDLSKFPQLTDRTQQGLLNTLLLGRLMIHPDGLLSNVAFHADGATLASPPVIDTSKLYYNGNSQGGILGGSATAVAPDFTRASLGVPAIGYSTLLTRSIDFETYSSILYPAYPNELSRPLALSLIQMLWDRSDPNGYAQRMTTNPLPNTPPHEVLLNVAFGDHQVTTWQADVEARTIGAQIHNPVVYDGRWPGVDVAWGIPRIQSYPFAGSAIVYWDGGPVRPDPLDPAMVIGTDPPPLGNVPNTSGKDPHGLPRAQPEEQQMVSDFLRPDAQSQITDTCGGGPCFDGGFTGP
jgi:hypothetical protein